MIDFVILDLFQKVNRNAVDDVAAVQQPVGHDKTIHAIPITAERINYEAVGVRVRSSNLFTFDEL